MGNIETFIVPLRDALERRLKEHGFASFEELAPDSGRESLYRFIRLCTWRKDIVQLFFNNNDPDSCRLDFNVCLIVEGRERILTAISVSQLKRRELEYKFPKLLKTKRAGQTIDSISNDVIDSLSWFDQYNSKKKCLEVIRNAKPEDNIAIKPAYGFYPAVEKMLIEP